MVTTEPPATVVRSPRTSLWTFRILAIVTSLVAFAQPLFAGFYLDGDVDAISTHENNAHIVLGLVFLQVIVAVIYWLPGRGRFWPLPLNVLLWFAVGLQEGMGYERQLGIHVPLGVTIIALQIGFTIWLFTGSAARGRSVRRPR